jgi:hypothetical protein
VVPALKGAFAELIARVTKIAAALQVKSGTGFFLAERI